MLSADDFARLFRLPPEEAVDYMKRRGLLTETFDWRDLWQDEHLHQFTVSRLARLDLLEAIRDGITRSVEGDLSRRDWMRDIQAMLQKEGWWGEEEVLDPVTGKLVKTVFDPARLKLIYDTNTNMAYSAGLWERIARNKATSPYIRYITRRDEKVRITHQAWDNLALPVDHPFWDSHFPPNGWRCRCRAMSMSQRDYDTWKAQGRLKTEPPPGETRRWVDKRSGEVHQVPIGIDPGFAYNPGKATLASKGQLLLNRAIDADPRTAALAIREYLSGPGQVRALADDFAGFAGHWINEVDAASAASGRHPIKTTGELRHVGALSYETWMALWRRNLAPESVTLSVRDTDVVHSYRTGKDDKLPQDWYTRLPEHLIKPGAVLLDTSKPEYPALFMVYDGPDRAHKLVVELGYRVKSAGRRVTTNIVRSGRVIERAALLGFEVLEGAL
ncbi:MAG: phage minor head protein [Pseudomonadota bacterium]